MKNCKPKKAIVLFMTLMFIVVTSTLILKNLDDTNKFIEESNNDIINTKALLAIKNIQKEFISYFAKNKSRIDTLLLNKPFNDVFILEYGDIKANISFEKYDGKYNINNLVKQEDKDIQKLFSQNNVPDFYTFRKIIIQNNKLYKDIENFEQLSSVIDTFIKQTNNNQIKNIYKNFSFINTNKNTLLLCNLDITVLDKLVKSEFIYNVTSNEIKGYSLVF